MARKLDGQVALVCASSGWGSDETSRVVALALGASGARLVVAGPDEKKVGETVGELVYQGAKARHVAGAVHDPAVLAEALARAKDVFGGLDVVVADTKEVFALLPGVRHVMLGDDGDPEQIAERVIELCRRPP